MAINPIAYTEKVASGFRRYQLTAYPLADAGLNAQMRRLLSIDAARRSPLLKGPCINLSRAFRTGCKVAELAGEPEVRRVAEEPGEYRTEPEQPGLWEE